MSDDLKTRILVAFSASDFRRYYESEIKSEFTKMTTSGEVQTLCCFHDETSPSLSINMFSGKFHCFGCGVEGDIFTFRQKLHGETFPQALRFFTHFVGIDPDSTPDLSRATSSKKKKLGELECVYSYRNITGNIVYEVCRYKNPKDFRQRRPHPTKPETYLWNLQSVAIIPYNLKAVTESQTVYICEGEKDCDRLMQIGLTATCNPMGAGKWFDSMTPYFQDKDIFILPDNDNPGKDHALLVAARLRPVAKSISIVNLPNLSPGGDVYDWLSAGNTKADLLEVVAKQSKQYEDHIDFLNSCHACITISGKFMILNEEYNETFKRKVITFSSAADLHLRYLPRQIPNPQYGEKGQRKMIGIVTDWLKSSRRREYTQIVFDPSNLSSPSAYNLWKGFSVEPKQGDWSLMRQHIFDNIACGSQRKFDWIMVWLARIVQDPGGRRPGTALVLRGDQGVGKGVFVKQFGKIFGEGKHYLQINNQQYLTGRFNYHLNGILLLFVDEGFWAGNKDAEGLIKGMVTEDLMLIEQKGRDAVVIWNHINLIIASNNDWVVPSGLDERRFNCLDVSDSKKQNLAYFEAIIKQMDNGGREAWMYDLLELDISKIAIEVIPRTDALYDQILSSMTPVQKFWLEIIRRGTLHKEDESWEGNVSKESLYAQYLEFCEDIGVRTRKSPIQFGKELRRMIPDETEKNTKIPVSVSQDGIVNVRRNGYVFPDLLRCRQKFCEKLTMNIDFDEDEAFELDE
uniref:Putative primase n=1 Tax=viral metagenome TaxID=1070528 RepID=A0A6M3KGL9_9ZZZZ